jgi:hypothetical protein
VRTPRRDVRRQRCARLLEESLLRGGRGLLVRRSQPVSDLALVDMKDRVRVDPSVTAHQAAGVIGVHVRDEHIGDLLRLDLGGAQAGRQLVQARAEERAGTCIDEDQAAGQLDQVGVDRGVERRFKCATCSAVSIACRSGVCSNWVSSLIVPSDNAMTSTFPT